MGFGLLFLGFTTLFGLRYIPLGVIGTPLMLFGISKLCRHAPYFKKAKLPCAVFIVYYLWFAIYRVLSITGFFDLWSPNILIKLLNVDEFIYSAVFFAFTYTLILSLKSICAEVGFSKGVNKFRLSSAFLNVFGMGALIRFVLSFTKYAGVVNVPVYLTETLCVISVAAWIYSCYMMIATQEIIDEENAKIAKYDEKHSKKIKNPDNGKKRKK